jgi:hypothetical protein
MYLFLPKEIKILKYFFEGQKKKLDQLAELFIIYFYSFYAFAAEDVDALMASPSDSNLRCMASTTIGDAINNEE